MLLSIWLSCQTVSQTSPQIADSSEAKWPTYESLGTSEYEED
ncbi:MAG: hypothetical protein VX026_07950 [Myxococcota bacterium]|nr:hypothetical protein [Myxococcota bacterium]